MVKREKIKIPKELSDKDMLLGYEENESVQDILERQEKESRDREKAINGKSKAYLAKEERTAYENVSVDLAGITIKADFLEELGKALLAQRLELAQEGIEKYQYKVKREGKNIIITPKL